MRPGKRNELEPRVLELSAPAKELWWKFYEHVEPQRVHGGELEEVREFSGKAAEHAARIAGVLTIIKDLRAKEIGRAEMAAGIALLGWYLHETKRLCAAGRTDPRLLQADRLHKWLLGRPGQKASLREILQFGP